MNITSAPVTESRRSPPPEPEQEKWVRRRDLMLQQSCRLSHRFGERGTRGVLYMSLLVMETADCRSPATNDPRTPDRRLLCARFRIRAWLERNAGQAAAAAAATSQPASQPGIYLFAARSAWPLRQCVPTVLPLVILFWGSFSRRCFPSLSHPHPHTGPGSCHGLALGLSTKKKLLSYFLPRTRFLHTIRIGHSAAGPYRPPSKTLG